MGKQYYFKRHELLHDKLSSEHKLLTPEALEAPNRDRLLPLFFVVYHNRVKPIKKYTKDFFVGHREISLELTRKLSSFWLAFIVLENTKGDVGEEKT